MRAVVTGGAGFIGSHVVERLIQEGWEVVVLDDFSTGSRRNLDASASKIQVVEGSVLDPSAVDIALHGSDAVVHLAAIVSVPSSFHNPGHCIRVNCTGTATLLDSCRRWNISKFVQASSSAVYGSIGVPPLKETDRLGPESPYASSKLMAEQVASQISRSAGFSATSLRFFNVYGPRQITDSPYSGVVSAFLRCIAKDKPVVIHGDGSQTRDFIHVRDVAAAIVHVIGPCASSPEVLNIGTGTATSIVDLAHLLSRLLGRNGNIEFGPKREGDVMHSWADTARMREIIPMNGFVSLEEGLGSLAPEA